MSLVLTPPVPCSVDYGTPSWVYCTTLEHMCLDIAKAIWLETSKMDAHLHWFLFFCCHDKNPMTKATYRRDQGFILAYSWRGIKAHWLGGIAAETGSWETISLSESMKQKGNWVEVKVLSSQRPSPVSYILPHRCAAPTASLISTTNWGPSV